MQQQDDYEELLELAKAIIPKTWNVHKYCDIKNCKQGKGILNIELLRYDNESCFEKDNPCQILKASGSTEMIVYLYGNGKTKISIHCMRKEQEIFTLLHELAHIAVLRLASYVTRVHKEDIGIAHYKMIEDEMHGRIFISMLNLFKNRAIKNGYPMFADYEISKDGHFVHKDDFMKFEDEY